MLSNNYHPNLQPRHGQNGIGSLDHDHIVSYLNHNKLVNGVPISEKDRADREKRIQKKRAKKRLKHQMTANVNGTKFEIVKRILESVGFTLRDDEIFKTCYLIWTDSIISQERITELKSYQRINHFMGMIEISRKDFLAQKFSKMQKLRPNDYNYFPKTWLFPKEGNLLHKYIKETKKPSKKKYFILKPANGAMGMGIRLFSEDDIIKSNEPSIVQEYIDKPCLLDGYKNDFRIYVLVTCCDPLRAFIYREGLVRLSTEKYAMTSDLKMDSIFKHLTNYSVNKKNSNYTRGVDESSGSKQSFSSLMNRFKTKFNINTDALWKQIIDIVVKTLILVQPYLIHNYRMCRTGQLQNFDSVSFEILGFDILLDENLCPWLLEVNRSPSFGMDENLDKNVKGSLLMDTFRLLNIKPGNKQKSLYFQKQKAQRRLTLAAFRSKIEPHLDNETLKKRKDIEKRKQDLIDLLVRIQGSSSREYFENRHVGKFSRIFPPDDKTVYDHYAELLVDSFTLFNQLNCPNTSTDSTQATQQMLQSFMPNQFREEDIMEQIKQCEKEENSLLEKCKLPQNAELTTIIPSVNFYETSSEEDTSSNDSESDSDANNSYDDVIGGYELRGPNKKSSNIQLNNANEKSENHKLIFNKLFRPQSARHPSTLVPKSTSRNSEHNLKNSDINKTKSIKPNKLMNKSLRSKENSRVQSPLSQSSQISFSRSKDLNKTNEETHRFEFVNNSAVLKDNFIKSPIYEELLKILLTSLTTLTIRYPSQSDSETKSMLTKIFSNWEYHRHAVATYWLATLNSRKRDKIIQIVKNNVETTISDNFKFSAEISAVRVNRLIAKVYNRLLWNRGNGLIQCFSHFKSWQLIFSSSGDHIKPLELDICSRVVQLCLDCVLIVYQFSISQSQSNTPRSGKTSTSQSVLSDYKESDSLSVNSLTA